MDGRWRWTDDGRLAMSKLTFPMARWAKNNYVPDLIWLRFNCSYVNIVTVNSNIAIRGRYSKYFIELFFLELFRGPFPAYHAQERGSDHAQATHLRFNWITIIELYDARNIAGRVFEKGDPGEKKNVPRIEKYRKQQFQFGHAIFKRFHINRTTIVKDFKQCLNN